MGAVVAIAAVLCAGCTFDTSGPVAADIDATVVSDARADADVCTTRLEDDFGDASIDPALWDVIGNAAAIVETNGTLDIAPTVVTSLDGVRTAMQTDFRNHVVTVELASVSIGDGGVVRVAYRHPAEQDFVAIQVFEDKLEAIRFSAGNPGAPPVKSATFNLADHRFLRMHPIDDATIDWETSGDGVTFTPFASASSLTVVRNTNLEISALDFTGAADTVGSFSRVEVCEDR